MPLLFCTAGKYRAHARYINKEKDKFFFSILSFDFAERVIKSGWRIYSHTGDGGRDTSRSKATPYKNTHVYEVTPKSWTDY